MKRRDLLAGIALAANGAAGADTDAETLYIPKPHRVEDRALLQDFMDEYAFADLVTAAPSLRITHIPVLLDRNAGRWGALYGHISRHNPQAQALDRRPSAVIVFREPHSYISPGWYASPAAVPTWNFAVVHASGKLQPIAEKKALRGVLARLVEKFERRYGEGTYDFGKLPEDSSSGMLDGIAGFEMRIDALEGKFKLGQERSAADRAAILKHLEGAKQDRSIRDFTASFYAWLGREKSGKGPA